VPQRSITHKKQNENTTQNRENKKIADEIDHTKK